MRVGTKLLLLVLLPVVALLAFASIAAIDHWHSADRLREFRRATQLSFASAAALQALADERTARTLDEIEVPAAERPRIVAAQRATDAAVRRAFPQTPEGQEGVHVAATLRTARRELDALRVRLDRGSLSASEAVEAYGVIGRRLFGIVRDLDSDWPSRSTGRAADAYVALVQAQEAAAMERVTQAAALVQGTALVRVRGVIVEAVELDTFRAYAARPLLARLDTVLSSPASATVDRVRRLMVSNPARVPRAITLDRWLAASGTRLGALRRLESATAGALRATSTRDLGAAKRSARWAVVASIAVLLAVLGFGLVLRRSITGPLQEVSEGARRLSAGDLTSEVSYAGRDEIGDLAGTFRALEHTADRLAGEIGAMSEAVEDDRLDHRADVAAFDGRWAELMTGLNDTMAAFTVLQGRREQAERHADRIFELSEDPLCIAGFDGYFKRVNPALEQLLGHPAGTLLSRPMAQFVHPGDRAVHERTHAQLVAGVDVPRTESRWVRSDGAVRQIEWSARAVVEQGLIYAVGRDVTDSRRAADEQAALRRVATLVAKGVAPAEIFEAVTGEVGRLCDADLARMERFEPDGAVTAIAAWARDGTAQLATGTRFVLDGESIAARVRDSGRPSRVDSFVGATGPIAREAQALGIRASIGCPITVSGRLWGVIAASSTRPEPFPRDTEERLGQFTDLVATAIANAESRAEVAASRARVVAAGDRERRRLVRDLHDGAQQGLVHTILALELATRSLDAGDEEAPALLGEALDHARRANADLRELSHGLLPASLTSGGLATALEAVAVHMPLPVSVDVTVGRLPSLLEATAYFVVTEALTNVVKHARAPSAAVEVSAGAETLRIVVRDDGVGGARPDGSGLTGLRDRVEALDGRLRIDSPAGAGTRLVAEVPLSRQGAERPPQLPEPTASADV